MIASESSTLSELKARRDIEDVLTRYCRGMDRGDLPLLKSCFFGGAIDNHGFYNGPAHAFLEQAVVRLGKNFISINHIITNIHVELDLPTNRAKSEARTLCLFRANRDGKLVDVTRLSRYLDQWECRNGEWKIIHRLLVGDIVRTDPVAADVSEPQVRPETPYPDGQPAGRGDDDPSTRFFENWWH